VTGVLLWLVDGRTVGDAVLARSAAWLGASETLRLHAFVRLQRRRQFLIGRYLLRQALGTLLDLPADAIALCERAGQAPCLAVPGAPDVGLSIAHSGDWIACAAGPGLALGLDIETLDAGRDCAALAAQAFNAEENAWLAARPAAGRLRDFYQLWSRHEARIKLGAAPHCHCFEPWHAQLSVALCSTVALQPAPLLTQKNLIP